MPYRLLGKILLTLALLGGAAFGVIQYNEHFKEVGRAEVREEYAALLEKAHEDSRKAEVQFNQKIKEANDAANRRNKQIDAAHAAATSASDGLRDALGNLRDSVPSATAASLAESTRTLAAVLSDCGRKYSDVAGVGDRITSEAKRCVESWPTYDKIK